MYPWQLFSAVSWSRNPSSVNLVQDGELASEALTRDKYHLLILDLNMPKMDGVAVLNHVRPKLAATCRSWF